MFQVDIEDPRFRQAIDKLVAPQVWADVRGIDIAVADDLGTSAKIHIQRHMGADVRKEVQRGALLEILESLQGVDSSRRTSAGSPHEFAQLTLNARSLHLQDVALTSRARKESVDAKRSELNADTFEADLVALCRRHGLVLTCGDGGLVIDKLDDGGETHLKGLPLADNLIEL